LNHPSLIRIGASIGGSASRCRVVEEAGADFYREAVQARHIGRLDVDLTRARWESYVWPIVAARVPQFESVKLTHQYAAHYEMNIFDHNAIVGPHTTVNNFHFINGFSGHGMQQSPAMGRGMAELLIHGEYRTLDLTPFQYRRIEANEPIVEKGVI
jgi:glycine/D-amino acid oxidase-like deaminating enzyme